LPFFSFLALDLTAMKKKSFRYQQVATKVEESIRLQQLRPGDKIASVRKVSEELNVSVNTVFQAYSILEAKGLIFSKPKSGYIIRPTADAATAAPDKNIVCLPANVEVSLMAAAMMKNARERGIVNLSILAPVNELLPISQLNRQAIAALHDAASENHQYPLVDGHARLLKQLARKTFDWQHSIDQQQILVTNGCMEAVNLCLDAIARPGDIIAVESPTYHGILQSLEQRGLRALEIGIDPVTGLNIADLERALDNNKITACVFMPSCHQPTGASMPEAQKIALVSLLGKRKIPMIEDDALGELCFREGVYPAKAYDKHNNVLYCSSFSKTLAPGFRVGWVSAGQRHTLLEKIKFASNISTNGVLQDGIARYLETGHYEKHIRKMRLDLQIQMGKYLQAIIKYFPHDIKVAAPQGGLSLWIQLSPKIDAFQLQKTVLQKGIGICPGHIFSASEFFHNFIRINYCPLWNSKIEKTIKILGKEIAALA